MHQQELKEICRDMQETVLRLLVIVDRDVVSIREASKRTRAVKMPPPLMFATPRRRRLPNILTNSQIGVTELLSVPNWTSTQKCLILEPKNILRLPEVEV